MSLKQRAQQALANPQLGMALKRTSQHFVGNRRQAVALFGPERFERLRQWGFELKQHVLDHLPDYLEQFETQARSHGIKVHWAETHEQAVALVLAIAKEEKLSRAIKGKSMVSEEMELNQALEQAGIETTETDLGEYIIQLRGEKPSHIIAPALHLNRQQVRESFTAAHQREPEDSIEALCLEARRVLRSKFLDADLGISGANFLVAETGSLALVSNEGNGRFVTTWPRVHIALAGIEKIIPRLQDLGGMLRLLVRSATGQNISNYVNLIHRPRGHGVEGAEQVHVVLLDAGRTRLYGSSARDALRCIRCGACMNHCPVYQSIGGHAYGWVYPGPIGSVLTPHLLGLEQHQQLPQAATLCNQCGGVCPVKIPLAELLNDLRRLRFEQKLPSRSERLMLWLWKTAALHPWLWRLGIRTSRSLLKAVSHKGRIPRWVPGIKTWQERRSFPAPR